MNNGEFDNTGWSGGMVGIYKDSEYDIGSCDFEERLVGLVDPNSDDLFWVRSETVTIKI